MIQENLKRVTERIAVAAEQSGRRASDITLLAVSKFQPLAAVKQAVDAGQLDFGENYPQELWAKAQAVNDTRVRWHLIGHLQSNKIAKTLPITVLTHSVDSVRLLDSLDAAGVKRGGEVPVLIEVNLSGEPNKTGFKPEAVPALGSRLQNLRSVKVEGLMAIAAYGSNSAQAGATFAQLRKLRNSLRREWGPEFPLLHLSMGMSDDFEIAIREGATIVRVGTAIFGPRAG
jgi:pyridoxal phosphate enzyme (YggS family)